VKRLPTPIPTPTRSPSHARAGAHRRHTMPTLCRRRTLRQRSRLQVRAGEFVVPVGSTVVWLNKKQCTTSFRCEAAPAGLARAVLWRAHAITLSKPGTYAYSCTCTLARYLIVEEALAGRRCV
jgi:hypothetical protein